MKTAGEEEEDDEVEESGPDEDQREKITVQAEDWNTCSEDEEEEDTAGSSSKSAFHNSSRLLHKDELLAMFKSVHNGTRCREGELTVGLVSEMFQMNYPQWCVKKYFCSRPHKTLNPLNCRGH